MNGSRQSALLHQDGVRVLRVDVAEVARHAAGLHGLDDGAARLQADALACAALLSAYLDDGERLTVQLQLELPRMAFTADVDADGSIRCRTTPDRIRSAPVLRGMLFVLKSVRGREVYRGITSVEHADLGAMLQDHLLESSQVPARVRVGDGVGVFAERLPGQAEEVDLDDVVGAAFTEGLDGSTASLRWACTCSRDRVLGMLRSLGAGEITAMIEEDDGATVTCNYCRTDTMLSADDLRGLLDA